MGRYRKRLWDSTAAGFALSVGFGVLCGFLCSVVCSAISYFVFNAMMFEGIFTVVSLAVAGYFSGYLCGKYRRSYGMVEGAICGGLVYLLLLAAAACVGEFTSPSKLIILVVSGAIGGISGVNAARPKNLM